MRGASAEPVEQGTLPADTLGVYGDASAYCLVEGRDARGRDMVANGNMAENEASSIRLLVRRLVCCTTSAALLVSKAFPAGARHVVLAKAAPVGAR